MTQYLFTLPLLFMTIICALFLTSTNQYILPDHKKGFFIAFSGEIFVIICEVLTIFLNGSSPEFKVLHFLSNYAGFLLTPILVAIFAASVGRFHRIKGALVGIGAYFVIFNILVASRKLFYIDAERYAWSVIGGICGSMWTTDFRLTEIATNVFESDVFELHAGEEFKVRQGASWIVNFGADGKRNGANIVVKANGIYVIRFTLYSEDFAIIELIPQ